MKRAPDKSTVKLAVANSTTSAALVGTAVDAKGFSRARFIFNFGTPLATVNSAKINASSIAIWAASGSNSSVQGAGTYVVIPSAYLAAASSGVISNNVAVLDIAIPEASFWLKVSGAFDSSNVPHSATVELYETVTAPPTHASPAPVIVN